MTPSEKFHALLAGTTVFIMFWFVVYVAPLLKSFGAGNLFLLSVSALVVTAGFYRILFIIIRWLMARNTRVRSMVLGSHYLHGTWIGWFVGHAGDKRLMIEHFNQDLDSLTIVGRSFTESGSGHGYWHSESVTIDATKGRLIFTYACNLVSRSSSVYGIHTSYFERESSDLGPSKVSGFAHDLNDSTRIAVHSTKVSEQLLPWEDALRIALERFG
jgi:hypothetical protein